jgi:hypothetical protein
MSDEQGQNEDYEATFIVELAPEEVWESLTHRVLEASSAGDPEGVKRYVLPGFPSFAMIEGGGASCSLIEEDAGRLLRVKKDDEPCAGTEIAVRLEQVGTGTRVTVVQSGFGALIGLVGRDTVFGVGERITRDFQLYLERRLTVPGTAWGSGLEGRVRATAVGLELSELVPSGFAQRAGMVSGDLLLTLGKIRVHDLQQLWTVLALTEAGTSLDLTWARGREPMSGKAILGG